MMMNQFTERELISTKYMVFRFISTQSDCCYPFNEADMGSNYIIDSGFYMTPLTAAIFIGALVTVGVLLITLLVSLTVMLQYCQNRSGGVVEIQKLSFDYDYCKALSMHLELNSLETDGIPSFCKDFAIQYIRHGQYERDLDSTLQLVHNYFCSAAKVDNHREIVLMDLDDLLFANHDYDDLLISRWFPDIYAVFFLVFCHG